ncbi:hypothetical protein V492_00634 [Pseudogymnoascus sp. VKM F-4246]|nr:hypothetical protein V492_00634 [Pseudogymnoascus sp. VKM F-4246]
MAQKSWDEEALQLQPPWGEEFPSKKSRITPLTGLAAVNFNAYVHGNYRAPPAPTGRRKALFIGINYLGQVRHLKNCINDAKNMSLHLFENYGYKREDTVILTDDLHNPMSQPTKQNILTAMHWLVKDAMPNDSLFFYYSGHGGQTKVLDGRYNAAIYPVDSHEVGHIVSDEMHRIMVTALYPGVKLTTLVYSHHPSSNSGSCSAELLNSQASQLRGALPSKHNKCKRIMLSGKRCNAEFSRIYDLRRHEDTIHNAARKILRCQNRNIDTKQEMAPPTVNPLKDMPMAGHRPISREEHVTLIKETYSSLVIHENKCIKEYERHTQLRKDTPPGSLPELKDNECRDLIARYKSLLDMHVDFLMACHSRYATPKMRLLPLEYKMPGRLWRHAIHSLLEILRDSLPTAQVDFIDMVHPIMTDLVEQVPEFKNNWTECLGDLFRYRMSAATFRDDWVDDAGTARQWYLKTATQIPETGRLYHHLAVVARPDELQQLYYYGKSLTVAKPFTAARKSIMTVLNRSPDLPVIRAILRSHAVIFKGTPLDTDNEALGEIESNLDRHIANITKDYLVEGYCIAICNGIALLGYGALDNPLALLLKPQSSNQGTLMPEASSTTLSTAALRLFIKTTQIHLLRIGDMNILSFLHVTLVFVRHLSYHPSAASLVFPYFPWDSLVDALNALNVVPSTHEVIESPAFPGFNSDLSRLDTPQLTDGAQQHIEGGNEAIEPLKYTTHPFPEDWAMQGLPFTLEYFPEGWFVERNADPSAHYLETETISSQHRPVRVLWLAVAISRSAEEWMAYRGGCFSVGEKGKRGLCHYN